MLSKQKFDSLIKYYEHLSTSVLNISSAAKYAQGAVIVKTDFSNCPLDCLIQ